MIAQERGSLEECNESAKRGGHDLFFWLETAPYLMVSFLVLKP